MARVLYVDDEDAIRRAVELWLARRGHAVETASTVAAARAQLERSRFDAVFIDLWIGKESGLELFQWVLDTDPETAARVAFVTGDPFDPSLASLERARPVLTKPFELRDLEAQALAWSTDTESPTGQANRRRAGPDADART